MTSIDWNSFKIWLNNHLAKTYASDTLRYCLKYVDLLINNEPHRILMLSKDKQRLVMSSLSNLSKFLGIYSQWKESMRNVGLKWSKADTFDSFMRIFNNNHNDLIDWFKNAYYTLNENEQLYLKFMLLSGLRKNEGILAFNLIIKLYNDNKLSEYYNEELSILEHFKYPKLFLRNTKNAYITIIPKNLISQIAKCEPVSYSTIRKHLESKGIKLRVKDLRSYYATYLRKHGIISELVDLLQGRVNKSVFVRHYLKESPKELSEQALPILEKLEATVNI